MVALFYLLVVTLFDLLWTLIDLLLVTLFDFLSCLPPASSRCAAARPRVAELWLWHRVSPEERCGEKDGKWRPSIFRAAAP